MSAPSKRWMLTTALAPLWAFVACVALGLGVVVLVGWTAYAIGLADGAERPWRDSLGNAAEILGGAATGFALILMLLQLRHAQRDSKALRRGTIHVERIAPAFTQPMLGRAVAGEVTVTTWHALRVGERIHVRAVLKNYGLTHVLDAKASIDWHAEIGGVKRHGGDLVEARFVLAPGAEDGFSNRGDKGTLPNDIDLNASDDDPTQCVLFATVKVFYHDIFEDWHGTIAVRRWNPKAEDGGEFEPCGRDEAW